jgi:hypothetical protein
MASSGAASWVRPLCVVRPSLEWLRLRGANDVGADVLVMATPSSRAAASVRAAQISIPRKAIFNA